MRRYGWLLIIAIVSALIAGTVTFAVAQVTERPSDTAIERAYRAGVEALARKDYTHATEQFGIVASLDPGYKDVQSLMAQSRTGGGDSAQPSPTPPAPAPSPPSGGGSAPATPSPPPSGDPMMNEPGFVRPADLASLLPKALPGYNPPKVESSADLVTGIYLPAQRGAIHQVTITIADRKTPVEAVGFVNRTIKPVYGHDAAEIIVNGKLRAYFGTSGGLYATVSWAKGTLGYQVLVDIESGTPRAQRPKARDIAAKVG